MTKPIIFGASGFIGRYLVQEIGLDNCIPVGRKAENPSWLKADLLDLPSIEAALKHSTTVINLAYSQQASFEENIQMTKNLVQACLNARISKLIHCSTAIVIGNNASSFIEEKTTCYPETSYEKIKYEIEKIFLSAINQQFTVHILRPTGVIGAGGQNLKKMLNQIQYGNPILNYIRSCFYGKRPLNLVPVEDVARALLHLCQEHFSLSDVFICSADDDIDNQYHHIEAIIRTELTNKYKIKPLLLPDFFLKSILKIYRTGGARFLNRYYSSEKLIASGFKRSMTLSNAIRNFILSEIKT